MFQKDKVIVHNASDRFIKRGNILSRQADVVGRTISEVYLKID